MRSTHPARNASPLWNTRKSPSTKGLSSTLLAILESAKEPDASLLPQLSHFLSSERSAHRDISHSIETIESAAQKGIRAARYLLGIIYENGLGVRRSIPHALYHYAIAAGQGHTASDQRWRWIMAFEGISWTRARLI